MRRKLRINNLFCYATGELSQDAFLCWLCSYATDEGWNEDTQLRECAIVFLNRILKSRGLLWTKDMRVTAIKKQYKNIDVLIQVGDIHIIIEDKTFTGTHHNQINRYRQVLEDEGILPENIICVYYKIQDQCHPEPNVDVEFTRADILDVFRPYDGIIRNPIFSDYLEYLECMESNVNAYASLPIAEWDDDAYVGFFKHLQRTVLQGEYVTWDYVPNANGGFMGLQWMSVLSSNELDSLGLLETVCNELFLQIEKDTITVKYSVDPQELPDMNQVTEIRHKIYQRLHEYIGEDFQKRTFRKGVYMTVGYVNYDEQNYKETLLGMKQALRSLLLGEKFL